ncbi:photosystem II reaction cent isoform B [Micractinium conductrix]|uniref:Photosystem II reaction center Psb28 protein n=1 Tax=Micractinium conductrix TaxID=554055 RepID=A0A2P6VFM8_9CHLO|nr:photosystem II reaction cent isoform B [Micractinium conductrix]|eukprot:PSC72893.1 photosystem II reaction cent isoform B [Micractinium conductrix]
MQHAAVARSSAAAAFTARRPQQLRAVRAAAPRQVIAMASNMQFIKGIDEPTIPEVKLTRSRDGASGTATFVFQNPAIFEASSELGDITGLYMNDDEGTITTVDVQAKFVNGKPDKIEVKYVMRSSFEWDRFMRFMERYAEDMGLGFQKRPRVGVSAGAGILPPPPWVPLLRPEELQRGLAFSGSGRLIERAAAKLLGGQPIKAYTIGGSVTRGAGASSDATSYPSRFFEFLNSTFPHRGHVLQNKGIGATTSGIYSVCAEAIIPPDADLLVAEFTFNEPADIPFTSPQRRAFEQLLRKLARLPGQPAVVVLHHYAWWFSGGDGVQGGLFYRPAEMQLTTMAQYYDMPSPSVRAAVWPLMRAGVAPFKVSRVIKPGQVTPNGVKLPVAEPGTERQYYFYDRVHPSDTGHQVMAELLAGVVLQAAARVQAAAAAAAAAAGDGGGLAAVKPRAAELPPPMIPGNADVPTTLCAMQPLAKRMRGFEYRAERPDRQDPVDQKWGYVGEEEGAWLEMEMNTLDGSSSGAGAQTKATVFLGYLRSYQGMGVARVECKRDCTCLPTRIDGRWKQRVSLTQMHEFQVSQHPRCRVRITIERRPSAGGRKHGGGKMHLSALMVSHFPLALDGRIAGMAGGMVSERH